MTEMVEVLGQGQSPPFAGLQDVRHAGPPRRHRLHADRRATARCRRHADLHRAICIACACGSANECQRLIALLTPDRGSRPGRQIDHRLHRFAQPRARHGQPGARPGPPARSPTSTTRCRRASSICCAIRSCARSCVIPTPPSAAITTFCRSRSIFATSLTGVIHRTSSTGETVFIEPAEVAASECRARRAQERGGPRGQENPAQAVAPRSARSPVRWATPSKRWPSSTSSPPRPVMPATSI